MIYIISISQQAHTSAYKIVQNKLLIAHHFQLIFEIFYMYVTKLNKLYAKKTERKKSKKNMVLMCTMFA